MQRARVPDWQSDRKTNSRTGMFYAAHPGVSHPDRSHHAPRPKHPQSASSATADENIKAVARIQQRAARKRTWTQQLTDSIAKVAACESTIAWHALWFGAWLAVNSGWLGIRPFDPFPFSLLTTIVSLEAIFLSLFVLASQYRMTQDSDRRAELDLQINLLSEQEMTLVLQMLREICEHHGLQETINSRKFTDLAKRTDLGELAERVEQNIGGIESTAKVAG
jgi:uncharacterized membrane protein